jgi:3',5'-cyclic AMP phosphodiesterase CpdA
VESRSRARTENGGLRIVQITDTHLSPDHHEARAAFATVVERLSSDPPDLIVNSGDIVFEDPDSVVDRTFARLLHDDLPAPFVVLPGNHDVGESGWTPWDGPPVTPARVDAFRSSWTADRFCIDLVRWRLIGLNVLVMASPLHDYEEEQEAWLDKQLTGAEHIALFIHKPIVMPGRDEEPGLTIEPPARERLLHRLAAAPVRLVASGHLHQYRAIQVDGRLTVWAPSTVFLNSIDDDDPSPVKGYVDYLLRDDGRVEHSVVTW